MYNNIVLYLFFLLCLAAKWQHDSRTGQREALESQQASGNVLLTEEIRPDRHCVQGVHNIASRHVSNSKQDWTFYSKGKSNRAPACIKIIGT